MVFVSIKSLNFIYRCDAASFVDGHFIPTVQGLCDSIENHQLQGPMERLLLISQRFPVALNLRNLMRVSFVNFMNENSL